MDLVLDATAGNRHMWGGDKEPDNVIFMDKEKGLFYPPTLFATWEYLPFREGVIKKGVFDPPHIFSETSMFNKNPGARPNGCKKIPGWYGAFPSKRAAIHAILKAQKEFARICPELFFKWNIASLDIDPVLTLFVDWDVVVMVPFRSRGDKPSTWWVKLARKHGGT